METINYKIIQQANATGLANQFPDLIAPSQKATLMRKTKNTILLPVIAFYGDEAIALSITTVDTNRTAQLISIFVTKEFQRKKIGTSLLEHTEKLLVKNNINAIQTTYLDNFAQIESIEKLLLKTDWLSPKKTVFNMKVRNSIAFESNWVSKALETSNTFEIFNWSDLNSTDICDIKNILSTKDFPTYLTPFQAEDRIDKNISKGVRVNGRLIGWCILHTINKQTRECSALYIAPDYRKSIAAPALMANAFKDMVGAAIDATIFQADYRNTPLITYLTDLFTTENCVINKACTLTVKKIINN